MSSRSRRATLDLWLSTMSDAISHHIFSAQNCLRVEFASFIFLLLRSVNPRLDLYTSANGTRYTTLDICVLLLRLRLPHLRQPTTIVALNHFNSQHKPPPHTIFYCSIFLVRFIVSFYGKNKQKKQRLFHCVNSKHMSLPQ